MDASVHLPHSGLGSHMAWTCTGSVHATFVCEITCASVLSYLEDSFLGVICPLCLLNHVPSLLHSSLSREEKSLMRLFHLGLSIQNLLRLCTLSSCGSVSVLIYFRRKHHRRWLRKALIYGYSRMSLKVILSVCSFSRAIGFGFPLDPSPLQVQASWPTTVSGMNFISWNGP